MEDKYPLHSAAKNGYADRIATIVQESTLSLINTTNEVGKTPLHVAVEFGQKDCVALLIAEKADINFAFGTYKRTPLHIAARLDEPSVLETLLLAKANVNAKDATGYMAIHYAAKEGLARNVELLLQYESNIDATNQLNGSEEIGKTPLQLACYFGHADVVALLCQHKARVNLFDYKIDIVNKHTEYEEQYDIHKTALYYAADSKCVAAMEILVANGAQFDVVADNGWSLLHTAAYENKPHVIQTLCELGADPNTIGGRDRKMRPLQLATQQYCSESIKELLKHDCIVEEDDVEEAEAQFSSDEETVSLVRYSYAQHSNNKLSSDEETITPCMNSNLTSLEQMMAQMILEEQEQEQEQENNKGKEEIEMGKRQEYRRDPTPEDDEQDPTPSRQMLTPEADQLISELKNTYSLSRKNLSRNAQLFFRTLETDSIQNLRAINTEGDNILHLIANSNDLAFAAATTLKLMGLNTFEQLLITPNNNGHTPIHRCVTNKNLTFLTFLKEHIPTETLKRAGEATSKNQGYNIFHYIGLSHGQNMAYALKGLFQGTQKEAPYSLQRNCLDNLDIDKKIFTMLDIAVDIYGDQASAHLAAQADQYGNNLVMLSCYTGNLKLIEKSVNICINGDLKTEKILTPLTITKVTALQVVCALGTLESIELIINLCADQRYDSCLTQNSYFDDRNILDWCTYCEAKTINEKATILKSLKFICGKLDDKLEIALTRQSPLGSLLCNIATVTANQKEFTQFIPLAKMNNKLALIFDIFSNTTELDTDDTLVIAKDSPLSSPRLPRGLTIQKDNKLKLALLRELCTTTKSTLVWLNYAICQIQDETPKSLSLHNRFILSFKNQVEELTDETCDSLSGYILLASTYDLGRKNSFEEHDLHSFCENNQHTLTKIIHAYYTSMKDTSRQGGRQFLTRICDGNSLLKLIISTLFDVANIHQMTKRPMYCSPLNRVPPEHEFIANFKLLTKKLIPGKRTSNEASDNRSML